MTVMVKHYCQMWIASNIRQEIIRSVINFIVYHNRYLSYRGIYRVTPTLYCITNFDEIVLTERNVYE